MNLKFSSRFGIFLSLFLISPLSQKVKATILEKMDLEKLTNNANLVVIGTVSEIRYDWDEQWKLIFTYVTLEIENCAKG